MRSRRIAAFVALACAASPSVALDGFAQHTPGVQFYFSVALDARNATERTLAAGFAIQGERPYERVNIDSRMINNFIGGGIEAKWIIAGVVAAGAAAAVATRDKSTAASYREQQQQQAAQIQARSQSGETCPPTPPACP